MYGHTAVKTQQQDVPVWSGPIMSLDISRSRCHQHHLCELHFSVWISLQKSEETCSHYRKWLSAVAECAKALTDSKAQVVKAEADVKVTLSAMLHSIRFSYLQCQLWCDVKVI